MAQARTTVVIPTFNRAALLARAIDSVIGQTVFCEVVVVAHGVSDDTAEVVEAYGTRVRLLENPIDYGPVFAWIEGALACETEFAKLLFDDDYLEPDFVELAESMMTQETGFVFSMAGVVNLNTGEREQVLYERSCARGGHFDVNSRQGRRVAREMVSPSALLLRSHDLVDALYPGKLAFQTGVYHGAGPDHFVKLLCMLRYRQFGTIAKPRVCFGSHPDSITIRAVAAESKWVALRSVYDEVFRHYKSLARSRRYVAFASAPSLWIRVKSWIRFRLRGQ